MTSHRRSLSESIVLEDNDKTYVRVSGNNPEDSHKGIGIAGAMKNDVIDILRLSKSSSKSLEHLDSNIKAPNELRMDTYTKLYNTKVKRFMKRSRRGKKQDDVSDTLTAQLRHGRTDTPDISSLIKPGTNFKNDSTGPEFSFSSQGMDPEYGHPDSYINGLSVPNVDFQSARVNTPRPKSHKIGTPDLDLTRPYIGGEFSSAEITTPDLDRINNPNLQMPHFNFKGPDGDIGLSNDIKAPDFNINAQSGKLKRPNLDYRLIRQEERFMTKMLN
ncbi:hypothetical protein HF521_022697 [Silurus meridionalis]|uniref:Uncharacterized protein n=1 Tax=Silurus meridionalis TaxID=175797 RepID=A0A8T0BEN6_SILME|nr:hypothetical protein HF521_022697 [Silurus meridionalis]